MFPENITAKDINIEERINEGDDSDDYDLEHCNIILASLLEGKNFDVNIWDDKWFAAAQFHLLIPEYIVDYIDTPGCESMTLMSLNKNKIKEMMV
jgi:hypothetical protein